MTEINLSDKVVKQQKKIICTVRREQAAAGIDNASKKGIAIISNQLFVGLALVESFHNSLWPNLINTVINIADS